MTKDNGKFTYSINDFKIGDFIVCVYDDDWWMSKVVEVSHELNGITVKFMEPHGPAKGFKWPTNMTVSTCSVKLKDVLLKVQPPTPVGQMARLHKFDDDEMRKIQECFSLVSI